MTEKLETRLGLVITDELYFRAEPDISAYMVKLFPYEEGDRPSGYSSPTFDGKACTELHIRLDAEYPTGMQQEYLRHLLKRGLLLDVTINGESVREKLMIEGARIANLVPDEGAYWREMVEKTLALDEKKDAHYAHEDVELTRAYERYNEVDYCGDE